jgi:hypothetical protein
MNIKKVFLRMQEMDFPKSDLTVDINSNLLID